MTANYESHSHDGADSHEDVTLSPAVPTGLQVGDYMVAIGVITNNTLSPPEGWVQQENYTEGPLDLYVWTKVADLGDTSDLGNWTAGGTYASPAVTVLRFTGADTTGVDTGSGNNGSDTSAECNNITVTEDDSLVLWIVVSAASSSTGTGEIADNDDGAYSNQIGVYEEAADAGIASGITITIDTYISWSTFAIALAPAAGAAGAMPMASDIYRMMTG